MRSHWTDAPSVSTPPASLIPGKYNLTDDPRCACLNPACDTGYHLRRQTGQGDKCNTLQHSGSPPVEPCCPPHSFPDGFFTWCACIYLTLSECILTCNKCLCYSTTLRSALLFFLFRSHWTGLFSVGLHICASPFVLGPPSTEAGVSRRALGPIPDSGSPDRCDNLRLAMTVISHCKDHPVFSFSVNGGEKKKCA